MVFFFLIQNSIRFWLVYRKAIDFQILSCVHKLVVVVYQFLESVCQFFQSFYIDEYVIRKQRPFYFFLPNPYIFYFLFFSYCIRQNFLYNALANTVAKQWSGGHLCLVSDLSDKSYYSSPLRERTLTKVFFFFFLQLFFIKLRKRPRSPSFLDFIFPGARLHT